MADEEKPKSWLMNFFDSIENVIAGLGTTNDPHMYSTNTEKNQMDRKELEALYMESWLAGKVIDIIPLDMTREWRTINSQVEPEKIEEFKKRELELDVRRKFKEAKTWARLYGGAAIILGLDESKTGPPDEPLDMERVTEGCLNHLTVVESERLTPVGASVSFDPMSPWFGLPIFWRLHNSSVNIHVSRMLFFHGMKVPFYPTKEGRRPYWPRPVLQRIVDSTINADVAIRNASNLTMEAVTNVIKYKQLNAMSNQPKGAEKIQQRFRLANLIRKQNNVMLLDEQETFERPQVSNFSGLGDIIDRLLAIVGGAADIPAVRLIGTSAKGLNATGEGDLKNYYDNIRAQQNDEFSPNLQTLDKVIQRDLWGKEEEDWSYIWNSLFQLTDKEIAEMEYTNAQRDAVYEAMGAIDPLIVAKQLREDQVYSNITDEHLDKLEAALEEEEEKEELPPVFPPGQEELGKELDPEQIEFELEVESPEEEAAEEEVEEVEEEVEKNDDDDDEEEEDEKKEKSEEDDD